VKLVSDGGLYRIDRPEVAEQIYLSCDWSN
jgi:hypothetical protein